MSGVLWDGLWLARLPDAAAAQQYMHAHEAMHAAVWRAEPFLSDGQTAVVSVASDGSVRGCFPAVFAMLPKGHRRAAIAGGVLELFCIRKVTPVSSGAAGGSSSSSSSSGAGGDGDVIAIVEVTLAATKIESRALNMSPSSVALRALAVTPLAERHKMAGNGPKGKAGKAGEAGDPRVHLVAYGGNAGLLRLHMLDLKQALRHPEDRGTGYKMNVIFGKT